MNEIITFDDADMVAHPVQTQWHHDMMIAAGFSVKTPSAVGLVRSYEYVRNDHVIHCVTGATCDYWRDNKGHGGYWGTLEAFLKDLS